MLRPPNDDYLWRPSTAPAGFQREEPFPVRGLGDGCWSLTLEEPVEGRSSVTVTEIFGGGRKEFLSPWTFEFEAPQP